MPVPKLNAPLTYREHRYLWLIAVQGLTPREAFAEMGCKSSPSVNTRILDKLNARRIEQAIFFAGQLDLIGPYADCGTMPGYRAHGGRHEDPCRACRRWRREYQERSGCAGVPRPVPLTEAELRLLRSFDSGRSFKATLETWGCSRARLDYVRTSLYRKLDVAHLPQGAKFKAAVEEGRRRGLLRPVAPLRREPNSRRWGTTDLTELELSTLRYLAKGLSLMETGREFGIPGSSVSARLSIIYRKLDVMHVPRGLSRREAAITEARARGYSL